MDHQKSITDILSVDWLLRPANLNVWDNQKFPLSRFQDHLQTKCNLHIFICQSQFISAISIWGTLYYMNEPYGPLKQIHWSVVKARICMKAIFKSWLLGKIGFTYLPNVTKSKVNKHNCYQFISVSHIWGYFHIHSLSEIFRLIQWQKNCCSNGGDSPTHHNTLKNIFFVNPITNHWVAHPMASRISWIFWPIKLNQIASKKKKQQQKDSLLFVKNLEFRIEN
jgi:hypothetical protein